MADDDHVQGGRVRRFGKLAYLAARTTGDLLAHGARKRKGKDDEAPELRKTAERILGTLGEMKGVALKLGQALAMDPDALPPEARGIIARLLSQAPQPMEFNQVSEVVRRELGAAPDELFAEFDQKPLAAASLGQVHAARLADGREVVLKIQYPGVDRALESDLANAGSLVRGISLAGDTLDGRPYFEELVASLRKELDYRAEAAQCAAYAHAARAYPELVVPEVIPERSAERVLCLTRLHGQSLLECMESEQSLDERFRVARLLLFAIWGPFFAERLIHADPHPGNFLVLPDGRLGVLDFGATKQLSETFAAVYRRFLAAHANGRRRPAVGPALEQAGFRFLDDDPDDAFGFCEEMADIVERPILVDAEYDFAADPMVQDARRLFQSKPGLALRIKPPAEALLFYRAAGGLAQALRLLRARGRFRPILAEIEARGIRA